MEELRDLQQIYNLAASRFTLYEGKDFVLPQMFKDHVKEINSNTITYNKYSAIIETRGNQSGVLNIYLPNQWFFIASYFTDFYNELQKYKKEALKVFSKERLKELNSSSLTDDEESRLQQLNLSEQSKSFLRKFVTDYSWWSGAKTIDRGDFYVSPILNSARLVNASQSFIAELCAFLADKTDLVQTIISGEDNSIKEQNNAKGILLKQKIYFGTPGSGKSFVIRNQYEQDSSKVIRTTFHPDTDYASFVGCYKPITYEVGDEKKIKYDFVPQAFTEAYVKAWNDRESQFYLILEEINRGNCAQIFGDLFQLLDRNEEGWSEYPINADADLKKYLEEATDEITGEEILINKDGIKDGKLCLPPNLSIIASMNTSDQSLFPMDSAFKRRWAWEYVPIDYNNQKSGAFTITIGNKKYYWHDFLKKINVKIKKVTSSEDKQMGNFFIKHSVGEKEFKDKVMFYLWSEVGKDNYQTHDAIFKCYKDGMQDIGEFSFNELYPEGTKKLQDFMEILEVKEIGTTD
jgi:hypothetical protein